MEGAATPVAAPAAEDSSAPANASSTRATDISRRGPKKARQDLAAERKILDAGRNKLAQGQSGAALKLLREHRDKWPLGALREEREALWVRTLVKAGMGEAAQRRGEQFLRRHPDSIHRAAVESALDAL